MASFQGVGVEKFHSQNDCRVKYLLGQFHMWGSLMQTHCVHREPRNETNATV